MNKSSLERLMDMYVMRQTTEPETRKIEAIIDVMEERDNYWIPEQVEHLLGRCILDKRIQPDDISRIARYFL